MSDSTNEQETKDDGKVLKFAQKGLSEVVDQKEEDNQKAYVGGECKCDKSECPLEKLDIKNSKGEKVQLKEMIEMLVMNNNECLKDLMEQKLILNKVLQVLEMVMADLGIEIDEKTGKIMKKSVIRMPSSKIIS